ncbi:prolipoprotein diacylglyceryl transferase [Gordonia spumicola]|uniref:Phosphatidylglycerol--prolipoprotein diacylglyceryl transferase n=1 Tax=Gordonia spumicola TaxID=589161 RepID=A0A7I9VD88_9ACTN|nr:prolipoprotein diacylglyceryl transferase [Gordonia spumicola]GEE03264.1 prolipoprotein diacylglyceryl transferase [Gordonia spumicola]
MTAGDVVLAYIPSPPQGVWHLGPFPLRAYALCIIVGIILAVWWGDRRWQARGGQPGDVLDVALIAVPFGLVGGRLYHVITDWWRYFGENGKGFGAVFQVWDGGLGIWGAVALGGVGAWVGCRWKGIKLPPFGDALAPAILAAQAIGRVGNYFNQELYGDSTNLPWGLELYQRVNPDTGATGVSVIDGVSNGHVVGVVHPTFLYELVWNLLIVGLLVFVDRRFRIGHGRLFAMYVAGYCAGRFWIELMRTDEATHILGLRVNVLVAALVFLGAALYVVMAPRGREEGLSVFRPERAEALAAEGEVGYIPETDEPVVDEPVVSDVVSADSEWARAPEAVESTDPDAVVADDETGDSSVVESDDAVGDEAGEVAPDDATASAADSDHIVVTNDGTYEVAADAVESADAVVPEVAEEEPAEASPAESGEAVVDEASGDSAGEVASDDATASAVDSDHIVVTNDGTQAGAGESSAAVVEEPARDEDVVTPVVESSDAVVEDPVESDAVETSVVEPSDAVVAEPAVDDTVETPVVESGAAVVDEAAEVSSDDADVSAVDRDHIVVANDGIEDVATDAVESGDLVVDEAAEESVGEVEVSSASLGVHSDTTGGAEGDAAVVEAEAVVESDDADASAVDRDHIVVTNDGTGDVSAVVVGDDDEIAGPEVPTVEEVRAGAQPLIVAHEGTESYTVSSSSDLDAITVVEENPGWSAGAIEIRPAAPEDDA